MTYDLKVDIKDLMAANAAYDAGVSHSHIIDATVWEDAISCLLETSTNLGLSPRTSQLATMYLVLLVRNQVIHPDLLRSFACTALCLAAKLEGEKTKELIRLKVEAGASSKINELERYLVSLVLLWKLSYSTPQDFLVALLDELKAVAVIPSEMLGLILEKATQLVHLLLLSIRKTATKPAYSLAMSSLMGAVSLLGEKTLLDVLNDNIIDGHKETVKVLLREINNELENSNGSRERCSTEPGSPEQSEMNDDGSSGQSTKKSKAPKKKE